MAFLKRFFGRRQGQKTADQIEKQIAEDYPDDWLRAFEFLCFPTDDLLREHLMRAIEQSRPHVVLVVGGVHCFETLRLEELPAYNICVNRIHDLGWLCEFCKYARNNRAPTIVVSNCPRTYSPPTVRFVVGQNYVAKVGNVGGTLHKTVAPPGASIALCEESDQSTTMGVVFCGLYALSYYHEVIQSQRRHADQLSVCAVLTTPADSNLLIDDGKRLRSSRDSGEQRGILVKASHTLELFPRFYANDDRYIESTAYSGGILANFTVPERIPTRAAAH